MSKKLIFILSSLTMTASFAQGNSESTEKYFETIKNNPKQLINFLHAMPKGGELHDHLGGASMAENMITYAKGDQFCVDPQTLGVKVDPNCTEENKLDNTPANPNLYNAIIDAWSMRNFQAENEAAAHDHAFAAFGKFSPIIMPHSGEILAEMAERASEQNELYLEVMITPDGNASGLLGKQVGWNSNFDIMRDKLLRYGLQAIVNNMSTKLDSYETTFATSLQCHTEKAEPGCNIKIRYLYQIYREQPPEQVFAQLLAGFELASQDPRVVGINMVQAENGTIAMRDYSLHMQMVGYLHHLYPKVRISLHAGESGPQIAPPEALRFHIREAIEVAHAERIGHGLDITFEDNSDQLFTKMANNHIMVETTPGTEMVLGFEPNQLPFPLYLERKVPVAISTDDEGVFRTNLTEQFENIVTNYHLSYPTLKTLVRNSIAYSFISGKSLWRDNQYRLVVSDCASDAFDAKKISLSCQKFLNMNEKAHLQWKLENQFIRFEDRF